MRVHALIIGYLKNQMPSFFGTKSKQEELLATMDDVFRAVQREYHVPTGDFPNLERFKESIKDYDFTKFPKLDLKCVASVPVSPSSLTRSHDRMIEEMDRVLSKDVPQLMNLFPAERQDQAEAMGTVGVRIVRIMQP